MKLVNAIGSFRRASIRRKLMALEVVAELLRARLVTLLSARIYTRDFGSLLSSPDTSVTSVCPELASETGHMVQAVAEAMPFRALCLQQAIAVRRILRRRGVRATVCLGVNRDPACRAAPGQGTAAHAWVEVGSNVISGDGNLSNYAVVARFV
jgi:hypothetical protein